jgi:hypothetical protein
MTNIILLNSFLIFFSSIISFFSFVLPHEYEKKGINNTDTIHYANEKHLKNVLQLTFGGDNAEAYFSFDNKALIFQATKNKPKIVIRKQKKEANEYCLYSSKAR